MHLKTLGGLELIAANGSRPLMRPKPLLLLAYLAIEGAKDRHHIAELFWPEASRPLNSLRVALTQLRSAAQGVVSEGAHGGPSISLSPDVTCDASDLLDALSRRDGRRAAELYSGRFLEGFYLRQMGSELEEWVYATREHLASRLQLAWLQEAETLAGDGAFGEAARIAEEAMSVASGHDAEVIERLHRLFVAGDHGSAREAARLASDYGMHLTCDRAAARRRLDSTGRRAVPTNLPAPLSHFVGRDPELVQVGNLLSGGARLLSIVGVGGVGKSRLALEAATTAARDGTFGDGVFLVELAPVTDPGAVLDAVAAAVDAPAGPDARTRLVGALADKRVLLVIDNFEHVAGAATDLSSLLESCPGLAAVVTSREPLELTGEQLFRLAALEVPAPGSADATTSDAVRLFRSVALRGDLTFELSDDDLGLALEICAAVHGLPLGIELAAAAASRSSLSAVATSLRAAPTELVGTKRDASPRHRSLRATIEHSWRLLSTSEARVLARLAAFTGGFTHEAAAHVAGANLATLGSLVAKALVRERASGRYDLHPLVADYAEERLAADPEEQASVTDAHTDYFLTMAEEAEQGLKGREQAGWLSRLDDESANLTAALRTITDAAAAGSAPAAERAMSAAGAIWRFWLNRGRLSEGRHLCETAVDTAAGSSPSAARAKALSGAGVLAYEQGDFEAAEAHHQEALAIRSAIGDRAGQARSLYNLASMAGQARDFERAGELLGAAIPLFREEGDAWSVAYALNNMAMLAINLGRDDEAVAHLEERLRTLRELGDQAGTSESLHGLGGILLKLGDVASATAYLEEALRIAVDLGDVPELVLALEGLAVARQRQGDDHLSARLLGAAEAGRREHGIRMGADKPAIERLRAELLTRLGGQFEVERRAGAATPVAELLAIAAPARPAGTGRVPGQSAGSAAVPAE